MTHSAPADSNSTSVPARYLVLVVEDDMDAFAVLRATLREFPFDIIHANSGQQAIEKLHGELPQLIFMDIDLPDMFGWQIMETFKGTGRLRTIPVIVLTAHREPVHRVIGSLQAVAVYLQKPFKADEVKMHVRQLLNLD